MSCREFCKGWPFESRPPSSRIDPPLDFGFFLCKMNYEANLSTQPKKKAENARFSPPHEKQEWSESIVPPKEERQETAGGIEPGRLKIAIRPCNKKIFGLPKTERIKGKKEIRELFSSGRRIHFPDFTLIYLPATKPKAGFIASKEIGSAVKRNRIKRIMREAFRMNKEKFIGLAVLFCAKKTIDYRVINKALNRLSSPLCNTLR
jgi:ribonuclease P protein component